MLPIKYLMVERIYSLQMVTTDVQNNDPNDSVEEETVDPLASLEISPKQETSASLETDTPAHHKDSNSSMQIGGHNDENMTDHREPSECSVPTGSAITEDVSNIHRNKPSVFPNKIGENAPSMTKDDFDVESILEQPAPEASTSAPMDDQHRETITLDIDSDESSNDGMLPAENIMRFVDIFSVLF